MIIKSVTKNKDNIETIINVKNIYLVEPIINLSSNNLIYFIVRFHAEFCHWFYFETMDEAETEFRAIEAILDRS